MNKHSPKPTKKNEVSIVCSSAAEYLTFVAAGGSSESSVEMRYEDENIWLTQKMMATSTMFRSREVRGYEWTCHRIHP